MKSLLRVVAAMLVLIVAPLLQPSLATAAALPPPPLDWSYDAFEYDYDRPVDVALIRTAERTGTVAPVVGLEAAIAPVTGLSEHVYDSVGSFVAPNTPGSGFANWGDEISDGARMVDQSLVDSVPPGPYSRPSGATTPAQRVSVQGEPCVVCGTVDDVQVADHIYPLVQEWYETGAIDLTRMREVTSVQPMCPTCSASQGGHLSWWSRGMREQFGFG